MFYVRKKKTLFLFQFILVGCGPTLRVPEARPRLEPDGRAGLLGGCPSLSAAQPETGCQQQSSLPTTAAAHTGC